MSKGAPHIRGALTANGVLGGLPRSPRDAFFKWTSSPATEKLCSSKAHHPTCRSLRSVPPQKPPCDESASPVAATCAGTPVEDEIHAREPTQLPEFSSALISLYFDNLRAFASVGQTHREAAYDEPTTLNAIALSRASGIPLGADDVSDATISRTRSSQAVEVIILSVDDVLAALTLGAPSVRGSVMDLRFSILLVLTLGFKPA